MKLKRLANAVKENQTDVVALRGIVIDSLSKRHREVYEVVKKRGPIGSSDVRAAHGADLSIQQISTILLRLNELGLVDRTPAETNGYIYRVVSA